MLERYNSILGKIIFGLGLAIFTVIAVPFVYLFSGYCRDTKAIENKQFETITGEITDHPTFWRHDRAIKEMGTDKIVILSVPDADAEIGKRIEIQNFIRLTTIY